MDEKKINKAEEVKEEVKAEENGVELTDEELSSVTGGNQPTVIIDNGTGYIK